MKNNKQNNQKKQKVLKICGLVGLFLLVFGVSFALFRVTLNGTKKNRITTANLSLQLLDKNNNPIYEEATEGTIQTGTAIDLTNAVPMSDAEGLETEAFEFKVKNNGNVPAHYDLKLIDENTTTLDRQYIRYVLETEDWNPKANNTLYNGGFTSNIHKYDIENATEPEEAGELLSTLRNNILDQTTIFPGEEIRYKLRLWIDYDATYEQAGNKTFEANLKLEGSQTKVYAQGKAGDNIDMLYYEDGTILLDGTGAIEGLDEIGQSGAPDFDNAENSGVLYFEVLNSVFRNKVDSSIDLTKPAVMANAWIKNVAIIQDSALRSKSFPPENVSEVNQAFDSCINGNDTICNTEPFDGFIAMANGNKENGKKIFNEFVVNMPTLGRVIISEGVTSISPYWLAQTTNHMVTIPSTVTSMGADPFATSHIYGVRLPDGMTTVLAKHVNDTVIEVLYIPNTVTSATLDLKNNQIREKIIIDNTKSYADSHFNITNADYPEIVYLRD